MFLDVSAAFQRGTAASYKAARGLVFTASERRASAASFAGYGGGSRFGLVASLRYTQASSSVPKMVGVSRGPTGTFGKIFVS